jgi:membrane-associated phospholipid phosphatase
MSDQPEASSGAIEDADSTAEIIVAPPRAASRAKGAETVFFVVLIIYGVLAVLAHRYAYFDWDVTLARGIQAVSLPGLDALMSAVSLLGNGWIACPLVIIAGLALIKTGLRAEGVLCMAGAASGWLVNSLTKFLIGRPRPSDELVHIVKAYQSDSFPSGHVVFFVEFFGFLFFLAYVLLKPGPLRRASLTVLGLLIVLVGVSRVYLGAHWPSDVAGAYLAGGIFLMLMIEVCRRITAKGGN